MEWCGDRQPYVGSHTLLFHSPRGPILHGVQVGVQCSVGSSQMETFHLSSYGKLGNKLYIYSSSHNHENGKFGPSNITFLSYIYVISHFHDSGRKDGFTMFSPTEKSPQSTGNSRDATDHLGTNQPLSLRSNQPPVGPYAVES